MWIILGEKQGKLFVSLGNLKVLFMPELKTVPKRPSVQYDMSDCLWNTMKTTIKSRLKMKHHTACVLDRLEHKVLPPGCEHDSHSLSPGCIPSLCLLDSNNPQQHQTRVIITLGNKHARGKVHASGVDRVVTDSHSNAH